MAWPRNISPSDMGKRMRRQRGAHAANAAIRASGRIPGQEARAAHEANAAARRLTREKAKGAGTRERVNYTEL